ncbi:MAG: hypothetical protein M3139_11930, partial [Bacteroidota bacterium]|nr:hypothetical protein [Bacteroidota bacterium]
MKKIFTFLFSMGLVACTFAQSDHRQQDQNNGNNYQPTQNPRSSQMNNSAYSNNNTYSRDQQYGQRNYEHGYAFDDGNRGWNDGFKNDHDRYDRGGDWCDRDHGDRDDGYSRQYTHVRVERN